MCTCKLIQTLSKLSLVGGGGPIEIELLITFQFTFKAFCFMNQSFLPAACIHFQVCGSYSPPIVFPSPLTLAAYKFCHSCYLDSWGSKHLSFYLILVISLPTVAKTCGATRIIYGLLCPFQSSSSPALSGECRRAHLFLTFFFFFSDRPADVHRDPWQEAKLSFQSIIFQSLQLPVSNISN